MVSLRQARISGRSCSYILSKLDDSTSKIELAVDYSTTLALKVSPPQPDACPDVMFL